MHGFLTMNIVAQVLTVLGIIGMTFGIISLVYEIIYTYFR